MTETTASDRVVIDSSGWLEFISADTKADLFAPYFADPSLILVPALVLYEVRKVLLLRHTKTIADKFVSDVLRLEVISIDEKIALEAAALRIDLQLPAVDALIYATAQHWNATLVTSDSHFKELPGVTLL